MTPDSLDLRENQIIPHFLKGSQAIQMSFVKINRFFCNLFSVINFTSWIHLLHCGVWYSLFSCLTMVAKVFDLTSSELVGIMQLYKDFVLSLI